MQNVGSASRTDLIGSSRLGARAQVAALQVNSTNIEREIPS